MNSMSSFLVSRLDVIFRSEEFEKLNGENIESFLIIFSKETVT